MVIEFHALDEVGERLFAFALLFEGIALLELGSSGHRVGTLRPRG
jgi:hypothetical protein